MKRSGHWPSTVETFIDNQTISRRLWEELSYQFALSPDTGIRHEDIANPSTGGFSATLWRLLLDPLEVPQATLAGQGFDQDGPRPLKCRLGVDRQFDRLICQTLKCRPGIGIGRHRPAVDRQNIVALTDIDARSDRGGTEYPSPKRPGETTLAIFHWSLAPLPIGPPTGRHLACRGVSRSPPPRYECDTLSSPIRLPDQVVDIPPGHRIVDHGSIAFPASHSQSTPCMAGS